MAYVLIATDNGVNKYKGNSIDTKPSGVPNGSRCFETDTHRVWVYDSSNKNPGTNTNWWPDYVDQEDFSDLLNDTVNDAQLGDMVKQVNGNLPDASGNVTINTGGSPLYYGKLKMPSDFTPVLPCEFYRDNDGLIKHNMNFNQYKGGTKIYVKATGNDTTGDGSSGNPYRTLKKAFAVVVAGGDSKYEIETDIELFNRDEIDFNTTLTNKTLAVISTSSTKSIISGNSTYSWTLDGTGTYKTSRTGVTGVIDNLYRDLYGLPVPLTNKSSLADCQATKGTWYTDGTYLWVHRSDESIPIQTSTLVSIGVTPLDPILSNSKIYFENFIFCGFANGNGLRIRGTAAILNDEACLYNCYFVGSHLNTGNGLATKDVKNTYVFNCIAAYAQQDGFNYHFDGISAFADRRKCFVLEYNCKAYHLGIEYPNLASNNASSIHEGANILRIGTIGYQNTGATIIDVNGCYSILYDCNARTPVVNGVDGAGTAFSFSSEGDGLGLGKTYMYNCSANDCQIALTVGSTHTAYINNFKFVGTVGGTGSINFV